MMDNATRAEVFELFPEIAACNNKPALISVYGETARDFIHKRKIASTLSVKKAPPVLSVVT